MQRDFDNLILVSLIIQEGKDRPDCGIIYIYSKQDGGVSLFFDTRR